MTYQEVLDQRVVSISISESPDMPVLGFTEEHLRDAMAEIARHVLALGASLAYGGDLRVQGFTNLLFELVSRHGRKRDEEDAKTSVTDYLAWPVHILMATADLERYASELTDYARLVLLTLDGEVCEMKARHLLPQRLPTESEWAQGLTSMRKVMLRATDARIVLGGRMEGYKGLMPGIAEEALLSLQARQPLFLIGGFGGCSREIAETLGIVPRSATSRPKWKELEAFGPFKDADMDNGLTREENMILAKTPHVDEAVALTLRGLLRLETDGRFVRPALESF
jgi:hypothetical protein